MQKTDTDITRMIGMPLPNSGAPVFLVSREKPVPAAMPALLSPAVPFS